MSSKIEEMYKKNL